MSFKESLRSMEDLYYQREEYKALKDVFFLFCAEASARGNELSKFIYLCKEAEYKVHVVEQYELKGRKLVISEAEVEKLRSAWLKSRKIETKKMEPREIKSVAKKEFIERRRLNKAALVEKKKKEWENKSEDERKEGAKEPYVLTFEEVVLTWEYFKKFSRNEMPMRVAKEMGNEPARKLDGKLIWNMKLIDSMEVFMKFEKFMDSSITVVVDETHITPKHNLMMKIMSYLLMMDKPEIDNALCKLALGCYKQSFESKSGQKLAIEILKEPIEDEDSIGPEDSASMYGVEK